MVRKASYLVQDLNFLTPPDETAEVDGDVFKNAKKQKVKRPVPNSSHGLCGRKATFQEEEVKNERRMFLKSEHYFSRNVSSFCLVLSFYIAPSVSLSLRFHRCVV